MAQGRYTWRHNRVLRELGHWIDEKKKSFNSMAWKSRKWINFKKAGEKGVKSAPATQESLLNTARDWKLLIDLPETPMRMPVHIVSTMQRPDIILTSERAKQLVIIELTVPVEERTGISSELKISRYEELSREAERKGWKTVMFAVEIGCRGFAAPSMGRMLKELGYEGRQKKEILKKLCLLAEESSMFIWKTAQCRTWNESM